MNNNPVTISPSTTIEEVRSIFNRTNYWSIYVVAASKPVGVITRNDLKNRLRSVSLSDQAEKIMSSSVYAINYNAKVEDAVSLLEQHRITSLAITNRGRLCGVVTSGDIRRRYHPVPSATLKNGVITYTLNVETAQSESSVTEEPDFSSTEEPDVSEIEEPESPPAEEEHEGGGGDLLAFLFALVVPLLILSFLSNIVSPYLLSQHSYMMFVFGNPKPVYFYDIDSSCNDYDSNIVSALTDLSGETGVKFIRLPSPLALIIGGTGYGCGEIAGSPSYAGEAESGRITGVAGPCILVLAWNKVRLVDTNEETILHETLHTMGFDHRPDPGSIMYPSQRGHPQVDADIIDFIKTNYVSNLFAYLNVLPLNLIYILGVTILLMWYM